MSNKGTATEPGPPGKRSGRPRLVPLPVREALIVDAATHVFARRGASQSTLDEIAAEAGTSKPAVYEHFASKAELYRAVVDRQLQRLVAEIFTAHAGAAGLSVWDSTRQRYAALYRYAIANPDGWTVLQRARAGANAAPTRGEAPGAAPPVDEPALALDEQLVHLLGQVLRWEFGAQRVHVDQAADVIATMLMTIGEATITRMLREPDWDPDAVLDLLTDFTTKGLAAVDRDLVARADRPRPRPTEGRDAGPSATPDG